MTKLSDVGLPEPGFVINQAGDGPAVVIPTSEELLYDPDTMRRATKHFTERFPNRTLMFKLIRSWEGEGQPT